MINIILIGANISGKMAGSQRMRNHFLYFNSENSIVRNLVVKDHCNNLPNIICKNINYNPLNPISIIFYVIKVLNFINRSHDKKALNIIYNYGYPSIENILFLKFSKIVGYKVVFDIVELVKDFDQRTMTVRMRFKNFTSRLLLNQLSKTGSMCFAISQTLVEFCKQISRKNFPVIHLPISANIKFIDSLGKISSNQDTITILYGGSFGLKDGIPYLIKGFEMAYLKHSKIKLILTGKMNTKTLDQVQKLIGECKCSNMIEYLGCLSTEEYFKTMINSDILCMTRIDDPYSNAGSPFKLGEYLASGNAVIASNVGDMSDYLRDKENALVIQPESAEAICEAILLLSYNKELRLKIGSSGKETAKEFFSAEKISELLYNSLLTLK